MMGHRQVVEAILRRNTSVTHFNREDECPLIALPRWNKRTSSELNYVFCAQRRRAMGRGILLWLLGIPIPVIIVLLLLFHH